MIDYDKIREIGQKLFSDNRKIAVVETACGGLISSSLISVSGASTWFDRSIIAYSNQAKLDHTGIRPEDLKMLGACSKETAEIMAFWTQRNANVDICLAETSLSEKRPGARSTKPAGLAFIAVANGPRSLDCHEFLFTGGRREIMEKVAEAAIDILYGVAGVVPSATAPSVRQ